MMVVVTGCMLCWPVPAHSTMVVNTSITESNGGLKTCCHSALHVSWRRHGELKLQHRLEVLAHDCTAHEVVQAQPSRTA